MVILGINQCEHLFLYVLLIGEVSVRQNNAKLLRILYLSEPLSADNRASRSGIFAPDEKSFIYIDNCIGGPHMQCCRLLKVCTIKPVLRATEKEDPK